MGKQHMMFASYIAPAWFLKEPSIEREQSHSDFILEPQIVLALNSFPVEIIQKSHY